MYKREEVSSFFLRRMRLVMLVVGLLFVVLAGRIWYLQVIQGDELRRQSENNRLKIRPIPAPRGVIYDRYGQVLAANQLAFELRMAGDNGIDLRETLNQLSQLVDIDMDKVNLGADLEGLGKSRQQLLIKRSLTRKELAVVESHRLELRGLSVLPIPQRFYPLDKGASHLLGYVGEISQQQLKEERYAGYRRGAVIGKSGLEEKFDRLIRGVDGRIALEVDSLGREFGLVEETPPRPGNKLVLTLDGRLQQVAEGAMAGKRGALVVMDPRDGQILAMVSTPEFDPGQFAQGLMPEEWRALVSDEGKPLQNRVLQGQYPPGSTFKVVLALAGLEEEVIDTETRFFCPGYFQMGERTFLCWKKEGHGWSNLHRALVVSCDVFFYRLGLKLGIQRMADYAQKLGLGKPTGFEIGEEKPGLIPTEEYRQQVLRRSWYPGEAVSLAIGQSFNSVTPLQLLNLYAAIANGGRLYKPWVVERIETPEGKLVKRFSPQLVRTLEISPANLAVVKKALFGVVNEPGGTGGRARLPQIAVAGKTGTAQIVGRRPQEKGPQELEDHAWFVAFAPAQEPEVAVVVLVEHGGGGGRTAAPIAGKVLEAFFKLKDERRQKMMEGPPLNISRPDQIMAWAPARSEQ